MSFIPAGLGDKVGRRGGNAQYVDPNFKLERSRCIAERQRSQRGLLLNLLTAKQLDSSLLVMTILKRSLSSLET